VGGAGLAIIDKADSGPQFGAEGLKVLLQPGQERVAKSRLGSYYARRADGGRCLFAAGEEKRAELLDLKVHAKSPVTASLCLAYWPWLS
jgi:hypothetical protein